ncbi:T9SS type A sorting domain-containing protein [Chitinophagaceae bacterium MMS25-I14]
MKRKSISETSIAGCSRLYSALTRLLLVALTTGFCNFSNGQSSNMDQGANGQLSSPATVTWQNGNLNANNSHYIEGQSVPYRLIMSGLPVGTPVTVTMNFDITHGGKYAIDFITGYNWLQPHNFSNHTTPEAIDPLAGTGVSSANPSYLRPSNPDYLSNNLAVPGAPQALASFRSINGYTPAGVPSAPLSDQNSITLWGGTLDQAYGVTYSFSNSVLVLNNVNQSVSFTFKFTPSSSDAVLAWGGHIARRQDWGTNPIQSAGGISGSPYHMRRESWSLGNIGNTDMQMQIAQSAPICPSDLNPAVSICTNSGGTPIACPSVTCMGSTLYYNIPAESGATGYSWSVTPSTGVTISPNNTSQAVSITFANSGSYTVNVSLTNASGINTICSVPVNISPGPTCSITGTDSICSGNATSFSATAGMSSYSWTGPGGFTASTQSTGPISTAGVYSVTITDANGCSGTCSRTLVVNNIPAAPSTVGASRCGPGSVTLSASGCAGGTLKWYDAASGGNVVNSGSSYSPNLSATASFWVSCTSAAGCEGPRTQVTDTINAAPSAPSTTGAKRCGPGTVTLNASGCAGGTLKWYDAASGGNVVNTGSSYSPNLSATASFWVSCTNAAGCEGPRTQVTDTINAIPSAPSTTGAKRCGPGSVTLNASGCAGGTLKWYDAASGGNVVNTGSSYSPNLSATASFWVSCTSAAGCEGPRTQVTDTINAVPSAPSTVGGSRCGPGTVTLSASGCAGGTLKWYDAASGGNVVNTGSSYSPNLSATTSFWVSCMSAAGCEGPRTQVTDTINAIPSAPSTTGAKRCGPGSVTLNASGCAGGTLKWYDAASGGNVVNTGSSYSPNLSATASFWVSCTSAAGCEGPRTQVTDTINAVPSAPSTVGASRCGPGSVTLNASGCAGGTLKWYDAASGGNVVNTGSSYSPNLSATASFWVSCASAAGCESARTQVTDTINAAPVVSARDTFVCAGATVPLSGTPSGGMWMSAAQNIISGNVFDASALQAGSYNVTYTYTAGNGCSNSATARVEVNNCNGTTFCTYTQGYYGNKNGNSCDGDVTWLNPVSLINHLLSTDLIIGNGGKSVKIPVGSGVTLNSVMPGGQTPKALVYSGQCVISTVSGSCFKTNYLTSQGRINNVLLSQTITLSLNGRMKGSILLAVPIEQGYLVTQKTAGCGTPGSTVIECTSDSNAKAAFPMNVNVVNYLTNYGGNTATVADLLHLANDVLGGALVPGTAGANNNAVPSYSDVNNAVDAINNAFDGCRFFVGYNLSLCPPPAVPKMPMETGANVIAAGAFTIYPNPSDGTFIVDAADPDGTAKVTITDLTGKTISMNASLSGNRTLVRLVNAAPGIYIIHISDGHGTFRAKILIH